ncbi:hypothetical protein I5421_05940 [Citrobacter braakii]|nr:hypothetical protein [Citrobacter braakii]MBJ8901133.1 hypothetical protein [Citrobacter braakii]MBJ8905788.1 hypothetical protein [Citrobacter braakii]MBJ8919356.1 hypothetical protein [Citrobacter braakii]
MNFKTVHGMGRADYAKKALDAAMSNLNNPEYVDAWIAWFDKQPADVASNFTPEQLKAYTASELQAANPVMMDQCAHCTPGVVCPDDCPQPEFYPCDLEEVAHAVVTRVESAIDAALERFRANSAIHEAKPKWLEIMFEEIRAEIAIPGYVEGLLPQ